MQDFGEQTEHIMSSAKNGEFTNFSSIIFWNSVLYLCYLRRLWKGPRDRFKLPMSEDTG